MGEGKTENIENFTYWDSKYSNKLLWKRIILKALAALIQTIILNLLKVQISTVQTEQLKILNSFINILRINKSFNSKVKMFLIPDHKVETLIINQVKILIIILLLLLNILNSQQAVHFLLLNRVLYIQMLNFVKTIIILTAAKYHLHKLVVFALHKLKMFWTIANWIIMGIIFLLLELSLNLFSNNLLNKFNPKLNKHNNSYNKHLNSLNKWATQSKIMKLNRLLIHKMSAFLILSLQIMFLLNNNQPMLLSKVPKMYLKQQ